MSPFEVPYHVRRKLNQKEVDIVEGSEFKLRCRNCGATWEPQIEGRMRLPKNYWRCLKGCNEDLGEMDDERRLRVLLVDDDVNLNKSLAAIIRKAGYEVVNVYNGKDMIEKLDEQRFDAVIMDVFLPDINGVELLKRVNQVDPVIGTLMLSGAATLDEAVESLNQGADAFILKPVDPGELLYRLGTITGFKRLERELREARARYNELFSIIQDEREP